MSSKDYNDLLSQIEKIKDETKLKDYHAFIYWFIETVYEYNKKRILDSICDGAHDKGIDAILIDDIEQKIIIIQSKFEHKGGVRQIKDSEIKLLSTVKGYFSSRKALNAAIKKGNEVTKRLMNEAFEKKLPPKNYSIQLIFISTHREAPNHDDLIKYTLGHKHTEFLVYDYDRIILLYKDRQRDFTPPLKPYYLPYKDSDKKIEKIEKTCNSWVITVELEQIRTLVNHYGSKLFRKNVRDFLGKSRWNERIMDTLRDDPNNFWYYNNGITILCDDAFPDPKKRCIRIDNPQIINGCQTVMSVARFEGDLFGDLLVRVIESRDHNFIYAVTLYQNSSNPIKKRDLKSNDPVQVRLRREFKLQRYYYEIKRGKEFKKMKKKHPSIKSEYDNYFSNEEVAKALATIKIDVATSLSKGSDVFFDELYNTLFHSKISTYKCLAPLQLLWIIRDTDFGAGKIFHMKRPKTFTNRAAHYVLRSIYDAVGKKKVWKKKFVSFYEDQDNDDFDNFYSEIQKISKEYFRILYKAWKKSGYDYKNTFLQRKETIGEIKGDYATIIKNLEKRTQNLFKKHIF